MQARHQSEVGCVCSNGSRSRDLGIQLYELGSQQSLWQRGSSNGCAAPGGGYFPGPTIPALFCHGRGVSERTGPYIGLCCCGRNQHCLVALLRVWEVGSFRGRPSCFACGGVPRLVGGLSTTAGFSAMTRLFALGLMVALASPAAAFDGSYSP